MGVLFVYSFSTTSSSEELSFQQAKNFVKEDLVSTEAYRFASETQAGDKFYFDVLVSTNAHGVCPTLEKRHYELFPISYRSEKIITSCSERSPPLLYQEEAVINTGKLPRVQKLTNPYSCVFDSTNFDSEAAANCNYFSKQEFDSLELPVGFFAVLWVDSSGSKFWALVDKSTGSIVLK